MSQPLATKPLGELLVAHPDNQHVLSEAARGKCGPAVGYLIAGLNPLYPSTVVIHTARYDGARWIYHVDNDGKMWLPSQQPRMLMAIPAKPHLSSAGGWHSEAR